MKGHLMQIPADPRLREYELTYILPASYTTDEAAKIHDKIKSAVTKAKGKVVNREDWGKKNFAYKIKHDGKSYLEGVYTHLIIELDRSAVADIERELQLNQKLLRYLLVIAEPTPELPKEKPVVTEEKDE
jgi:small subunit ribosomal protein S6